MTDFHAILRHLVNCEVEFLVVGGIAAVLQGAPITTFDLDVVHSRRPENVEKLLAALAALDAQYREAGPRVLSPSASHLASRGHQLLATRFGPLDLLGAIGTDHDFNALAGHAFPVEVGPNLIVRVLDLVWVIRTKEEVGSAKDNAVLTILRETLAARNR